MAICTAWSKVMLSNMALQAISQVRGQGSCATSFVVIFVDPSFLVINLDGSVIELHVDTLVRNHPATVHSILLSGFDVPDKEVFRTPIGCLGGQDDSSSRLGSGFPPFLCLRKNRVC